jgi:hypothetical protein
VVDSTTAAVRREEKSIELPQSAVARAAERSVTRISLGCAVVYIRMQYTGESVGCTISLHSDDLTSRLHSTSVSIAAHR